MHSATAPNPSSVTLNRSTAHRLGAAGVRAIAGIPAVGLRGGSPTVGGRPIMVLAPFLTWEDDTGDVVDSNGGLSPTRRGVLDGLGLRLAHSDPQLHQGFASNINDPLELIVFDIAEQFRCEALADPALYGSVANRRACFDAWVASALGRGIAETGVGLLVFTLCHMLRYRLLLVPAPEAVDDVIEATRGNLGRLIGHALRELPSLTHDQRAYAQPALEIARLVADLAADVSSSSRPTPAAVLRNQLLVPDDWDPGDSASTEDDDDPADLDSGGIGSQQVDLFASSGRRHNETSDWYKPYTTAFDVEVAGTDLYPDASLIGLRSRLDKLVASQAVSPTSLAQRLRQLFVSWHHDHWSSGHDDGFVDPSRLAQMIANPLNPNVHRRPTMRAHSDAAVTFLVDTTGSMKKQRYENMAVLVDTLARAVELAGGASEVLGFTTASWAGGQAAAKWRLEGQPANPGRLADIQHIIYKAADQPWRRARRSLSAMLRTDHYREGVDGEALMWAWQRLLQRPEKRRLLVLISDGKPMEATTCAANGDSYLARHLAEVCHTITTTDYPPVSLGTACLSPQLNELEAAFEHIEYAELDTVVSIGTYDFVYRLFS